MKKVFKVVSIALATIFLLVIMAISLSLWMVFTPEKLTPIVRKQAANYLTCQSEIGSVELTFFSTYPNFGLKINQLTLINPTNGSPSDTLISLDYMVGVIDAVAWWKRDEIKIKELILNSGTVTLFYDSLGGSNLNIFLPDTSASTESNPIEAVLENIRFENITISYVDYTFPLTAIVNHFTGNLKGKLHDDVLSGKLKVSKSTISINYDGEDYLQNSNTKLDLNFEYWLNYLQMNFDDASGSINDLPVQFGGAIYEDTLSRDMIFDLAYKISSSPVEKILTMIPPSYQSYFEGISATGMLDTDGTIVGKMNETAMPLFTLMMKLSDGKLNYEGVPLSFKDIHADVVVVTDAMSDSLTYLKINSLKAKTNQSSFEVSGIVNLLFTDVYCNLNSHANLTLNEFNSMLPDSLKMKVEGKAIAKIKSSFTLTQLEKMQFDRINISGSLNLSNFDATYDTLWVKAEQANIDFALPIKKPTLKNTSFISANVTATNLFAGANTNYSAYIDKTILTLEASNVMDTTRIPNLICSFNFDSLSASMDTISLAIANPMGKFVMSPREGFQLQPQIQFGGSAKSTTANIGKDLMSMKSFEIDADVINDNTQKDLLLQWLVKGFIEMEQGYVSVSSLSHPLEIPSLKMNFNPENFNIQESSLVIDKSDFQLSGSLSNIHSYFKNDSILRGNFSFTSNNTDVNQLMLLTSGIGYENPNPDSSIVSTEQTGPYMVPKGMDIALRTNIKQAKFGSAIASNIKGDVFIRDGILVLDDLRFKTPATRIQLTAMYRTPRKNHLYLGIDYHMLDVEIEQLLEMVPEIDSLMPMLRSFRGKGEFHMAAETYMDSLYNLKKSTLRGAASITGNNLVLMDGETFSEIAKTLKFNKKTENKVDSLSAEFTVFKNEIDVYPFLIVMDKYKGVVSGRHNLDMSFDYHISVVECPLPIKLGIDVKGTLDNLSYKLAKCKYGDYYRPVSRHTVANKQLELRKMIRESLVEKLNND